MLHQLMIWSYFTLSKTVGLSYWMYMVFTKLYVFMLWYDVIVIIQSLKYNEHFYNEMKWNTQQLSEIIIKIK